MTPESVSPAAILEFWFGSSDLSFTPPEPLRGRWFQRSDPFDEEIHSRFSGVVGQAFNGELDYWRDTLDGQVGLILLCDQFSRNIFRGSAAAFTGDPLALEISQAMIRDNTHTQLGLHQRAFVGMPLEHSEHPEVQEQSVAYFDQLQREFAANGTGVTSEEAKAAASYCRFAVAHHKVIQQFGRYPHRNQALGRESTAAEQAWLDNGGGF
ncbi:DUF924 family protein [Microbulbifer sp. HZ11]|uniref:DUF924 family protein n=1 Tax=Microbulbifer sp. HZ11 TaxID=1453501 RepID=UPI0005BD1B70|nr:DUF924 family protein [Microbulbifer sp. HZ11]